MALAALPNNPMNFTENQHGNVILERLRVQKDAGRFCDVTLYVEGKQFRAHRNVLASCSPYFNSILKMQRIVKEHLTITCKSSEVFQCLLNYMYTGSVVIDKENVGELVRLSNHFLVSKLKNYCSEYLERYLEVSNCVSVKEMSEKYNMTSLLKQATGYIKANIGEVMKQEELLDASIALVEGFLSDDAWTVPQDSLIPFISKWVRRDLAGREQHTRKLLTFVDWSAMDQQAITEHVDRDPLYTRSEVALFAVLQALHSNNVLLNKYQAAYDSLHSKMNQGSSAGGAESGTEVNSMVKLEAPSPAGSDAPKSPSARPNSNIQDISPDDDSNFKEVAAAVVEADVDAEADIDSEMMFVPEGNYSDDSSDGEDERRTMKEEVEDPDYEGEDEGFSKEEPLIDIKEDPDRTVDRGGEDDDEEEEEDDDDDDDNDNDMDGVVEGKGGEHGDVSPSRDSDDSQSERKARRSTRASRNATRGGVQKKKQSKSAIPISAIKAAFPGGARRGRPPGSGKRQREIAAALAAARQNSEDGTSQDGEEQLAVKKLKCKQCKFRARDNSELDQHVNDAHQGSHDVTYKCTICDFTCGYIKEYYRHLKKHFPGPPFKCDNCDYTCDKMVNLVAHRSKTCDDKPHHCTMCDYKCRSRPYLLVHMRSHTGELPYKCETCGRAYAMRSTLEQHLTSHSKEQPYLCDACGFATKYIAHLMAHKRIHTGDVHRCTFPDCKYSTPKKSQLISHARTHEGVRPHTCHICGRGFLEKSHLVRHERIHLDDKPFKCEQCDYASSRRDKLKEHYSRHHGDNASARVPYKARIPRTGGSNSSGGGDPRKSDTDMVGEDFNMDNASSTQSSNHGMNLTSTTAGLSSGGTGEMADLLLAAHNMSAQQHLKYASSFAAGLQASTSDPTTHSLNMDHYHHPQQHQMHTSARLSLAGVPSNGDPLHLDPKETMGQTLHSPPPSTHHMLGNVRNHQSAAAMAAMMLDGRVGYQTNVGYPAGAMPQLAPQSSSLSASQAGTLQSSEYPSMSSLF